MREYLIIIEKAGDNFSAYSPDVPGCIATGATKEETELHMREALSFHLDGLQQEGLPIPEPMATASKVAV